MFIYLFKVDNRPSPHGGTVLGGTALLVGAALLAGSIVAYAFIGLDLVAAALGEGRYANAPGKRLLVLSLSATLSALVTWLAWRCRPAGSASARRRLAWGFASAAAGLLMRLDRLGRSLQDLITWALYLEEHGVALESLAERIDTATSTGKLTFHLFGALAEFERNLIRERTQAGLAAARARGRLGGRPPALDGDKQALAVHLYREKKLTVTKICSMMGISKPTLYAYVRSAGDG